MNGTMPTYQAFGGTATAGRTDLCDKVTRKAFKNGWAV
jgi:hypothetical protein